MLPLFVLSALCSLSLGSLSSFTIAGLTLFDFLDNTPLRTSVQCAEGSEYIAACTAPHNKLSAYDRHTYNLYRMEAGYVDFGLPRCECCDSAAGRERRYREGL